MSTGRFVGAQEFRRTPDLLLAEVTSSGQTCFITEDGKARAVLLDINRYHALMDLIEESESLRQQDYGDETRKHISVAGILRRSHTTRKRK
jgi:hypothetical protein